MSIEHPASIPGIVKNGVVVPQNEAVLPDGAHVEIVFASSALTPELRAEFAAWDRASDEAWSMIETLENEGQ